MHPLLKVSAIAALAASAWALFIIIGVALWMLAAVALGAIQDAKAHDIYGTLRDDLTPTGRLCCGGDPVTGDCEGVVDYQVSADGTVSFFSRRYGMPVSVAKERVTWASVPGGEAYPAHFCGKPRAKMGL